MKKEKAIDMNIDKPVQDAVRDLCDIIENTKDINTKIDLLNYIPMMLHNVSPLRHHPVDFVTWKKNNHVEKNDYNPNSVAPPETHLLITSIEEDGYTMPIVINPENGLFRIVDGFHRRQSEEHSAKISASTFERLPDSFIRESQRGLNNRMAAIIRHNRSRGAHDIDRMATIVRKLISMDKSSNWISKHVGMDMDEILRLKQLTGIADLFTDKDFSFGKE